MLFMALRLDPTDLGGLVMYLCHHFRFMTVEGTSKNRIISPGKVLHFYNSPPDSTVDSLNEVFAKVTVSPPNGVKFFSQGTYVRGGPRGGGRGRGNR